MRFFSRYLLLYAYSLRRLDEATEGNVYDFLEDWFPKPRAVGLRFQHEGLPGLVQEILQMDGRDRLRTPPQLLRMCSQRSKTTETSSARSVAEEFP